MKPAETPTKSDVLHVGRVVEVRGRSVKIAVDASKNRAHLFHQGQVLQNVTVGGYVKIHKGFSRLIGKIDGERMSVEGQNGFVSKAERLDRVLEVEIIGFLSDRGMFEKGIRELPLIDNECFVLTTREFESVHSFVPKGDDSLEIGKLPMQNGMPAKIGVNSIFASHIGIFGNTGSGKSYTLAKLFHEFLSKYRSSSTFRESARLLILDFNGEYVGGDSGESPIIGPEDKREFRLSTRNDQGDKLPISVEQVRESSFWTVLLDATEKTQTPFLQRTLDSGFWDERLSDSSTLTAEIARLLSKAITNNDPANKAAILKFLDELNLALFEGRPSELSGFENRLRRDLKFHGVRTTFMLETEDGIIYANGDPEGVESWFESQMANLGLDFGGVSDIPRIRLMIVLQYYSDVINGYANREHLAPLIKRLERRAPRIQRLVRATDDEHVLSAPLNVVSLRDVEIDMKKVIPLLVCKQVYEAQKSQESSWEFLGLIIDEAHNILSTASVRESETWKDYRLETFEEIVKEGRKFGVFLTIASQRPFDISQTITSQLHNYFLHRLVNHLDIQAIEHAVSYLDKVAFDSLPILPVGTCIMSGVSTQVPVLVQIAELDDAFEPKSATPYLVEKWRGGQSELGHESGDSV